MPTDSNLKKILALVAAGKLSPAAAQTQLLAHTQGFTDLGFAQVDHARQKRCGLPEVIFAAHKTTAQILAIAEEIIHHNGFVLITRTPPEAMKSLCEKWADAACDEAAGTVLVGECPPLLPDAGRVLVIAAGTSDIPVAREAAVTIRTMGIEAEELSDVGVAGIHRLFAHTEIIRRAAALVVVAGMEGALPSVVGGMVSVPVVAVPTSVGYGASFGGVAALLAMLNSCAAGVSVVNIDNGFGAGVVAARIARAGCRVDMPQQNP